ncbi:MAG: CBS domain-containing protein, partial [Usitatibacter sp.]
MKVERNFTRSAVTASRFDTIEKVALTMRRLHVGALLVTEKTGARQEVVGIVTDRDLVMLVLAEGLDAREVAVEKVMTPVVASVAQTADV